MIRFSIISPFILMLSIELHLLFQFVLYSYLKSQPSLWLTYSLRIMIKTNFNLYYTRMLQYKKFQPFWPRGFEDLKKCLFTSLKSSIPIVSPNLFLVIIKTITINQWLNLSLFLFEWWLDPSLYKLEFSFHLRMLWA